MPSPGKHPCYQKGKGKKFPHFWRSQIHVKKTKQGLRSWGTFHPLSGLSDCELYTVDIFFCCIFFCSAMTAGSYKMTQGFAGGDRDGWWSFSKNQKTTPQRFWFPLTPPQHLWFYNGQIGFMMVQYIYIYTYYSNYQWLWRNVKYPAFLGYTVTSSSDGTSGEFLGLSKSPS